jgi:hypothetical protein
MIAANHEGAVGVLEDRVDSQDRVIRLDNGAGRLGHGVGAGLGLGLLAVVSLSRGSAPKPEPVPPPKERKTKKPWRPEQLPERRHILSMTGPMSSLPTVGWPWASKH